MKDKPKFNSTTEMLAFLKKIGTRNEEAIRKLDKAIKYEETLVEMLETNEPSAEYKRPKK